MRKNTKTYIAAALSIMMAGIMVGCSSKPTEIEATPTPSVEADVKFYEDADVTEIVEIKDKDGKVTETVSVSKLDEKLSDQEIKSWYNDYVSAGISGKKFDYAVIIYSGSDKTETTADNKEATGIYADDKNIYTDVKITEEENSSYSIPKDAKPTYEIDSKTHQVIEDVIATATPETTAKPKETEKPKEETGKTTNSSNTSSNTNSNVNTNTNTNTNKTPTTTNNNSSSSSSSGNTNNKPGNTSSSSSSSQTTPTHTHNWVQQYKTVHHDAVTNTIHHDAVTHTESVWVQDSAAWDETVQTGSYGVVICNTCGSEYSSVDDWGYHSVERMDQNDFSHGRYHVESRPTYTTVHHDATGHYQDNVIVDQAAWDETVVTAEAYDEQVPNGYKCSGCGQTK